MKRKGILQVKHQNVNAGRRDKCRNKMNVFPKLNKYVQFSIIIMDGCFYFALVYWIIGI